MNQDNDAGTGSAGSADTPDESQARPPVSNRNQQPPDGKTRAFIPEHPQFSDDSGADDSRPGGDSRRQAESRDREDSPRDENRRDENRRQDSRRDQDRRNDSQREDSRQSADGAGENSRSGETAGRQGSSSADAEGSDESGDRPRRPRRRRGGRGRRKPRPEGQQLEAQGEGQQPEAGGEKARPQADTQRQGGQQRNNQRNDGQRQDGQQRNDPRRRQGDGQQRGDGNRQQSGNRQSADGPQRDGRQRGNGRQRTDNRQGNRQSADRNQSGRTDNRSDSDNSRHRSGRHGDRGHRHAKQGFLAFPVAKEGKRIKVLVAGPTKPPSGGVSTVLNDMMASSLKNKVDWVLHDNSKRTPPGRSLWQGIKSQLGLLREYVKLLRSEKPDLVHVHSGGSPDFYRKSLDVLLARFFGTKVVFHNKGGDFNFFAGEANFLKKMYIRFILKRCDRVMVLSEWWKEFHSKFTSPERIRVLYNGINAAPYEQNVQRNRARHLLGIPRDKIVFLMMGVKGKRKGAYDIVEAAPLVKQMDDNTLLLLVGPDENTAQGATQELVKLRAERGVEDIVELHGEADAEQRYLYYAAADVFLLPSYAENSPVSIIEAMAARLPVIATRIAAVPELVDDGKTGILIEPGKPADIAEIVVQLSKDLHLRRQMGNESLRKFRHRFDMERAFVQTLYGIYKEVALGEAPAKQADRSTSRSEAQAGANEREQRESSPEAAAPQAAASPARLPKEQQTADSQAEASELEHDIQARFEDVIEKIETRGLRPTED